MADEPETLEEAKTELRLRDAFHKERETTDKLYAIKLVEVVVFGMVGLILMAVIIAIVALVVR